uniref:RING-type domain-containing protein n=1 Tax=Parastrongyloides trichosuri TaxID=131310 RepID=A0A0N4ZJE4_PARTI
MNSNYLFFCSMFCRTAVPESEIVALRSCGHTFHKKCIIAYFNLKNKTTPNSSDCPVCRTPADMNSFLRIYVSGNVLDLTDKKSVIENEDVIINCIELIAEQKRTIDKLQHEGIGMKSEIALQNGAINSFKETIAYKNNVKNETIPNSSECPICRTPADMKSFLRIYVTGNILDLTDKKSVIENEDVINNCVELIAEQKRTIQKLQHEAIGMKTEI